MPLRQAQGAATANEPVLSFVEGLPPAWMMRYTMSWATTLRLRSGQALGSTSLVVDESGAEACPECNRRVGHVIYDALRLRSGHAYGAIVENTIPLTLTDRLYTGQVYDASTGLYFYNARYYDPVTGQFTQPDSIIPDPLDPRAWNRFGYVYGNPSNLVDPTGHFPIWDLLDIASFGMSLNDFANEPTWGNAGWLALDAVGLLPILPSVGLVRHAGKLDEVGDVARVARRLDSVGDVGTLDTTAKVVKADIIEDLSTGTSQSKRIAQEMQRGRIGVNVLGDEIFEKAYRYHFGADDVEDVVAFAYGRQVYFRKGSATIFSDAVHEGTHALDFLNKRRLENLSDLSLWEKRAYFHEHMFQLWKGRPREFDNFIDILDHIKKHY